MGNVFERLYVVAPGYPAQGGAAGDIITARDAKSGTVYFGSNAEAYFHRSSDGNFLLLGGPLYLYDGILFNPAPTRRAGPSLWGSGITLEISGGTAGTYFYSQDTGSLIATLDNAGKFTAFNLQIHQTCYLNNVYQAAWTTIYPGDITNSQNWQNQWYLASHPSYGLYTNTGLFVAWHLYAAGPLSAAYNVPLYFPNATEGGAFTAANPIVGSFYVTVRGTQYRVPYYN